MGLFAGKREKLGEILIKNGLATKEQVEDALDTQKEIRDTKKIEKTLGAILVERGIITSEDVVGALKEQRAKEGFILKGLIYSIFHSKSPR